MASSHPTVLARQRGPEMDSESPAAPWLQHGGLAPPAGHTTRRSVGDSGPRVPGPPVLAPLLGCGRRRQAATARRSQRVLTVLPVGPSRVAPVPGPCDAARARAVRVAPPWLITQVPAKDDYARPRDPPAADPRTAPPGPSFAVIAPRPRARHPRAGAAPAHRLRPPGAAISRPPVSRQRPPGGCRGSTPCTTVTRTRTPSTAVAV